MRTFPKLTMAAIAAAAAFAAAPGGDADPAPDAARAADAYAAMVRFFHHDGVWAETSLRRGWRPAQAWPFSQALAATLDVARGDASRDADVVERLRELRAYWNPDSEPAAYDSQVRPPLGRGGTQFLDDNEWIGIDLVRAKRLLGRPGALNRAALVFRAVLAGWDSSPNHACPGGVMWTRTAQPDHRNTVSTANGALLAVLLDDETRNPSYLAWAQQAYAWVYRCLGAPNGLFWDHLDSSGKVEPTQWSYNQGAMIEVGARLYQLTGDESYLRRAAAVADAAVAQLGPRLDAEPPSFVGIFFDDLLLLDRLDASRSYDGLIHGYAERMWQTRRDPHTGLFRFEPGKPVQLLEQAAMVRIYASLAAGAPW